MAQTINPVFAIRGDLNKEPHHSTWTPASPWPDGDIAFQWTNFDYPRAHTHEYWELLLLVSGTLYHEVNGQVSLLKQQQACLLRPEDCHSLWTADSTPVIILNFMIKREQIKEIFAAYGQDLTQRLTDTADLSFAVGEEIFRRCIADTQVLQLDRSLSFDEKINRCKILFIALLSELMMQKVMVAKPYPQWLCEFLLKLSNSDLSNISIKTELSEGTGYSYSRLIYLFKEHMGCTIAQYLTHLRIARAKEYLRNTDMRMIDIAAAVGCDNVTHFNRIFKSATGMSPTQFRLAGAANKRK